MANWKCCKCNTLMEEVEDIQLKYKDLELPPARGYRCPVCGEEYLDSEYVTGELAPAEQMMEGK